MGNIQLGSIQYISKFRLVELLATGGMGNIYLAEQLGAEGFTKEVVIKTIRRELLSDRDTMAMFSGEAKLMANLVHENIIQVYAFEEHEGNYFLVMEYAQGPNLFKFMERHRFLQKNVQLELGVFIVSQIARALEYIHLKRDRHGNRLKIVHRDISPTNILLSYQGVAKLIDFGIAKAISLQVPDEHEVVLGKCDYMSPEQSQFEATDMRSDIYSLGIVAYEILTLQKLFRFGSDDNVYQLMRQTPIEPIRYNPTIPKLLEGIIKKALAFDPQDRFQTASEFHDALKNFLYQRGVIPSYDKLGLYVELLFPEGKKRRPSPSN